MSRDNLETLLSSISEALLAGRWTAAWDPGARLQVLILKALVERDEPLLAILSERLEGFAAEMQKEVLRTRSDARTHDAGAALQRIRDLAETALISRHFPIGKCPEPPVGLRASDAP